MLFLATANASINDLVNPLFIIAFLLSSLITMFIAVYCYSGVKSKGVLDATVIALIGGWGILSICEFPWPSTCLEKEVL
jgi:hypothetical protein